MRRIIVYLTTGFLVVLAMDFVAPPVGLGLVGAKPAAVHPATMQFVDRTHKGDRLKTSAGKQRALEKPPVVLVGCDPVFSPLSASASANNARRCVA